MGKTNFNMQLTDTEKEIMDFVTTVIYDKYNFSKADMVSHLFKKSALEYLDLSSLEKGSSLPDEEILYLLKHKKREDDKDLIRSIGIEKFREALEEGKEKYPALDYSSMEAALLEVEEGEKGDKVNG